YRHYLNTCRGFSSRSCSHRCWLLPGHERRLSNSTPADPAYPPLHGRYRNGTMSTEITLPDNSRTDNTRTVELDIQGMTCASCVGRVERKLGKIEGVEALVNLPLNSARVTVPNTVTDEQLLATVESAGYHANLKVDQYAATPEKHTEDESSSSKKRL